MIWLAGPWCFVGVWGASETGPGLSCPRTGDSGPCLAGGGGTSWSSAAGVPPPPRALRLFRDLDRPSDLNMACVLLRADATVCRGRRAYGVGVDKGPRRPWPKTDWPNLRGEGVCYSGDGKRRRRLGSYAGNDRQKGAKPAIWAVEMKRIKKKQDTATEPKAKEMGATEMLEELEGGKRPGDERTVSVGRQVEGQSDQRGMNTRGRWGSRAPYIHVLEGPSRTLFLLLL